MIGTLSLGGIDGAVVRFVGDVHMGDGGRSDLFRGKDDLFVATLAAAGAECDLVVFMGDAVDLPQAFLVRRVAAAHPEAFRALEDLTRRTEVVFLRGNHDWNVHYDALFPAGRTCERLELGDVLACHGHQLDNANRDPGGAGYFAKLAAHAMAERVFNFEFRVPLQRFDTPQNRVAHWLGYQLARVLRRRGTPGAEEFIHHYSRTVWGDVEAVFEPAMEAVRTGPHRALVIGHTHTPGLAEIDGDRRYVNAGAWAHRGAHLATWDGTRFRVEDAVSGREIRDEHFSWMLAGEDPGDFFEWWRRHYRGRLRFEFPEFPEEPGEPGEALLATPGGSLHLGCPQRDGGAKPARRRSAALWKRATSP